MSRFVGYAPCRRCRDRGADRRGDNLAMYDDGSQHCFACGFHTFPKHYVRKEKVQDENKAVLPHDWTREVPATAWKWLLQYGLPYSYWKPFTGYSPAEQRLILTHGTPVQYSVGRYVGSDAGERARSDPGFRKWRAYGDRLRVAEVLGDTTTDPAEGVVLVEDIVSGHKVAQAVPSMPLFGTSLYPKAIRALRALKRPVTLWLDEDQYGVLPAKINRLQAFLDVPVGFIRSRKDPKNYTTDQIREILHGKQT